MAGIYLHIPFCRVKCSYCDFHFSTNLSTYPQMINALQAEIVQRKGYLKDEQVQTIYFGGGTPGIMNPEDVDRILESIHKNFSVAKNVEITLECNPDDLSREKLRSFQKIGANRLSIGIQSFEDKVLQSMNRAHNADQAKTVVSLAQDVGFDNITIDLIYGVPDTGPDYWKKQLDVFLKLNVPHLSSYALTIEPGTLFGTLFKQGNLNLPDDSLVLEQFQYLMDFCQMHEYEQYEISNFSKPGFISNHNSAYWLGHNYLGIGPSAHSYDGAHRGWNVANNHTYIKQVQTGELLYHEQEILGKRERFNDYVLTRLRTKWGLVLDDLVEIAPEEMVRFEQKLDGLIAGGLLRREKNLITLTNAGKYQADGISADLFMDEG